MAARRARDKGPAAGRGQPDSVGKKGAALDPLHLGNCTCFNLRKTARAMTQAYDAALQPTGLKATQYSVLAVVAALGPMSLSKLADELVLDRTTLTRNLGPLEAQGRIVSQPGEDRRARLIAITGAGRRVLDQAEPLWRAVQTKTVKRLGEAEWADLINRLEEATEAAHAQH